jgi:hypothetical protein
MFASIHKEARTALLVFLLMLTATGALAAGFTAEEDDDDMTAALVQCGVVVKVRSAVNVKPTGGSHSQRQAQQTVPPDPASLTSDTLPQPTAPALLVVPLRR